MSLMQKLQAAQQRDSEPRRPSMAPKNSLTLPFGSHPPGGPRRTSSVGQAGPRTTSMSGPGGGGGGAGGPSLMGLLASKRLAKRFASRFHSRRGWGSTRHSTQGVPVQREPTYRMVPHNKFQPHVVVEAIKTLLEDRLGKFRYSPKICSNMCKMLSDDIKDKVKLMNFDRYKIVTSVLIGQKKDQAIMASSRCAWDEKLDSYASYTFQNEHIFCTATVFGIYNE